MMGRSHRSPHVGRFDSHSYSTRDNVAFSHAPTRQRKKVIIIRSMHMKIVERGLDDHQQAATASPCFLLVIAYQHQDKTPRSQAHLPMIAVPQPSMRRLQPLPKVANYYEALRLNLDKGMRFKRRILQEGLTTNRRWRAPHTKMQTTQRAYVENRLIVKVTAKISTIPIVAKPPLGKKMGMLAHTKQVLSTHQIATPLDEDSLSRWPLREQGLLFSAGRRCARSIRFSPLAATGGENVPAPHDPYQIVEIQSCGSCRCPRSSTRAKEGVSPQACWEGDADYSTQRERRHEPASCSHGQRHCLPLDVQTPAFQEADYGTRFSNSALSHPSKFAATPLRSDIQRPCFKRPERVNWPKPSSASAAHAHAPREPQQYASRDEIGHHRVEAILPAAATPRVMLIPEVGQQPAHYDAATESPHGKLRVSKNSEENAAQEVAHQTHAQQQQSQQIKELDRPKRREQQHQQVLLQDATRFYKQQIPVGAQEMAKQVGGLPHPPTRQQHRYLA
ncbi:hypothetical protein Emed_007597 [Eimeria media]